MQLIDAIEHIEFVSLIICSGLVNDDGDPVIDHTKEYYKNSLAWMCLESFYLRVKLQYHVSVHTYISKGILNGSEEDRHVRLILHQLYYLAINTQ